MLQPPFDPELWFLAMEGDEIAGFCLAKPADAGDEAVGSIPTLGVRRAWRGRGIGLALLRHAFTDLRRRGKRSAVLGVDADSPTGALRLYERAGMRVVGRYLTYEKTL
jgi:ribosomal protein S18 acetylase RimI-like enzyme